MPVSEFGGRMPMEIYKGRADNLNICSKRSDECSGFYSVTQVPRLNQEGGFVSEEARCCFNIMGMKLDEDERGGSEAPDGKLIIASLIWIILAFSLLGGLLFGCAGRLDWETGWIFMITIIACAGINFAILLKTNPEVIEERSHLNRGAKKWDIVITSVATIFILATLAVAGFDERYGWCGSVGPSWGVMQG
jgi:hypothetical protein